LPGLDQVAASFSINQRPSGADRQRAHSDGGWPWTCPPFKLKTRGAGMTDARNGPALPRGLQFTDPGPYRAPVVALLPTGLSAHTAWLSPLNQEYVLGIGPLANHGCTRASRCSPWTRFIPCVAFLPCRTPVSKTPIRALSERNQCVRRPYPHPPIGPETPPKAGCRTNRCQRGHDYELGPQRIHPRYSLHAGHRSVPWL
jgi:hypothetical protein